MNLQQITANTAVIVRELAEHANLGPAHLIVMGVSTSEIAGARIGTSGAEDIAAAVWNGVQQVRREHGFAVAFQCCEHLNRALVVERRELVRFGLEEVAAVPILKAGGAMASHAFRQLEDACLAERIQAHAGIDIGDTLIGMHLRPVAVPFRPSLRQLGQAHVNAAWTRPKLIGGERACYTR
ncbi:TIGR01440 family protein [Xylanibacillus composti]|uniref:UPF0340 protein XYCOK13_36670 n=1 Tax=Xylanibacillus composti TaxID=1572762 RepID=A0A8J4H4J9_9BACL|nr:TIGR01440 family protein [Xylanibacillus composti]MDT9726002.1 TIGR01440 family protein [Xylanibacillus composti]GIQ70843.1 UPF0340 protein YwlG [Xylanibacillus composti]